MAFARQLDNFAAAIRGEQELRVTPEEAVSSVAAVESAYRALDACRWEEVKAPIASVA